MQESIRNKAWQYMNVIPALGRQKHKNCHNCKIIQDLIVKPCLRKKNKIMKHNSNLYVIQKASSIVPFVNHFLSTVRTCYLHPIILFLIEDFYPSDESDVIIRNRAGCRTAQKHGPWSLRRRSWVGAKLVEKLKWNFSFISLSKGLIGGKYLRNILHMQKSSKQS